MYLDYEKTGREIYVIDIETDDLNATKIWVMCWKNVLTGETGDCIGHEAIKEFFNRTKGSVYIGHNILKFDAPTLVRLLGVRLSVSNCIDTLVLSTLYSPSLQGGHSLAAWGERLGYPKGDYNDWSHYNEKMLIYCRQDVLITCELFVKMMKVLKKIGFSEKSIWIQHRFTVILERQRKNGFYFDGRRALSLYNHLRNLEQEITEKIHVAYPPKRTLVATRQMYTKSGGYTAIYQKDRARYIIEDGSEYGEYHAYEDVPFSIGSPKQRVDKLLELGWEPQEFTPANSPKPFDKGKLSPSLEKFLEGVDAPEIHLIPKWMSYNGRANMINTWLNEWNEDDSCIHGKLFTADTLRCRHQAPNTANIPAVRTKTLDKGTESERTVPVLGEEGYFTYEARDLWCARPGRLLVGTDAAGLELRMLAHYLNRPDFTKQVVEGDPHQYNADVVGITRPQAKTLIYAIMYGAAAPKIAATLGVNVREGARIRTLFLERLGLKKLIEECQEEQANGRVSLVDGSQVICPSPHAALNYKLQGGGARVMAQGAIFLEGHIRHNKLDCLKVGDIHDEWQFDVHPDCATTHGELAVQSIREAGEELNLSVPLDGESKIGKTWAETH